MNGFQQNQLLFKLDIPAKPLGLSSKFLSPEPIIIEKFLPNNGPIITVPRPAVFQFSAVSEDSLSSAIQLARRDLKKQRELDEHQQQANVQKKKTKSTGGGKKSVGMTGRVRAQLVQSDEYRTRLRRRDDRKQKPGKEMLIVKEREAGNKLRSAGSQTAARPQPAPARVPSHRDVLPAAPVSPPTRDREVELTGDAKILIEIKKLRTEMDNCLHKIRQMQEAARRDPASWQRQTPVYAEDIEDERKRVARSEAQATRSAQIVYSLSQQVRGIQDDINKIGAANIRNAKKSDILSRLAAVHRGAVRALQAFLQHLPDVDLTQGLPRSYHELGLLLRQLSLCCAQLEVAGETGVPDSVKNILRDYDEMNRALERDLQTSPKSPPRPCQQARSKIYEAKKKSPASRKLNFGTAASRPGQRSEEPKPSPSVLTIERVSRPGQGRPRVDATPDRQAALKAGVAALVRAAQNAPPSTQPSARPPPPVPRLNLPVTPRTPQSARGVAWEFPLEQPRLQQWKASAGPKGLLLPRKLQEKRQRAQRTQAPAAVHNTHYSATTLSSRMKKTAPEDWPQSPPRSPRAQRKSRVDKSPRGRSHSPRASSLPGSPRSPGRPWRAAQSPARDALRQVQLDRENAQREAQRHKIQRLREELGQSDEWLGMQEQQIKDKVRPLLDQAQSEVNADLLTDSLLCDALEDTALELSYMSTDRDAELEALSMINAPSLEVMLQRLHGMETEQQDIRRRWATLVYEEENMNIPARTRYFDAPASERPSSPTPIHLTSCLPPPQRGLLPDYVINQLESHPTKADSADSAAIMFTKTQSKPRVTSTLHFSQPSDGSIRGQPVVTGRAQPAGIAITLTQDVLESIESNRRAFEEHLKRSSHQAVGKFNPWQVVEQVADEIVEECIREVSAELDDVSGDIVNHIYCTEFTKAPSPGMSKHTSPVSYHFPSLPRSPSPPHRPIPSPRSSPRHSRTPTPRSPSPRQSVTNKDGDVVSRQNSRSEAVTSSARSPSPDIDSTNYSYDDDFVDSSPRGRVGGDTNGDNS